MRKRAYGSEEHNDGSYVVKKSRKSNILAFIACVLIAFVVWAYAVYTEDGETKGTDSSDETVGELCAEIRYAADAL